MLAFLTPPWLAALDDAARADQALAAATSGLRLVIEQRVHGTPAGDVTYHVVLDHGEVAVAGGPADSPTVTFDQDHATARGIAAGTESAQRAFMSGRLRVGGDLRVLLEHQASLLALGDVFAAVRERTDLAEPHPGAGPIGRPDTGPDGDG